MTGNDHPDDVDGNDDVDGMDASASHGSIGVPSNYKVLGRTSSIDSTGVLGANDKGNGTPIGVVGTVDMYSDSGTPIGVFGTVEDPGSGTPVGVYGSVPGTNGGYGLWTPNDGRIEGDLHSTGDFDVVVDDQRIVQFGGEDGSNRAGNVVLGHSANGVLGNAGTISGGGSSSNPHVVGGNFNAIGGGRGNEFNSTDSNDCTIAGGRQNVVDDTSDGVAIGGGEKNKVPASGADYAVVGGGYKNVARGTRSTIAGGGDGSDSFSDNTNVDYNLIIGQHGFIGGGGANQIGDDGLTDADGEEDTWFSTIGGGIGNRIVNEYGTIAGGYDNTVDSNSGSIGGGFQNTLEGDNNCATIGGGCSNVVNGAHGTVSGGRENGTDYKGGTIGGGRGNDADGVYATVAGGGGNGDITISTQTSQDGNVASSDYSTIGGGGANHIGPTFSRGKFATIAGGVGNLVDEDYASIGGGWNNTVESNSGTVGGGFENTATSNECVTIGGGCSNYATGKKATIGGGLENTAVGDWGTVPGGWNNQASGAYSFAAGHGAVADADKCFIWSDGSNDLKASEDDGASPVRGFETFNVCCYGGMRVVTTSATNKVTWIESEGQGWSTVSSRSVKTNFESLDHGSILDKLDSIPILAYEFKDEDGNGDGRRTIGPMAEDFHDVFDLGGSDKGINQMDADGIAFAAIKGLKERLDEARDALGDRDERIEDLEAENDRKERLIQDQRDRIASLEDRLSTLEAHVDLPGGGAVSPADD